MEKTWSQLNLYIVQQENKPALLVFCNGYKHRREGVGDTQDSGGAKEGGLLERGRIRILVEGCVCVFFDQYVHDSAVWWSY